MWWCWGGEGYTTLEARRREQYLQQAEQQNRQQRQRQQSRQAASERAAVSLERAQSRRQDERELRQAHANGSGQQWLAAPGAFLSQAPHPTPESALAPPSFLVEKSKAVAAP